MCKICGTYGHTEGAKFCKICGSEVDGDWLTREDVEKHGVLIKWGDGCDLLELCSLKKLSVADLKKILSSAFHEHRPGTAGERWGKRGADGKYASGTFPEFLVVDSNGIASVWCNGEKVRDAE